MSILRTDSKETNTRDILAYSHQLAERTANGKIPPYDYAMSQIGHEMGHRWSAFVSAKIGNETIRAWGQRTGPRGLQAPARVPISTADRSLGDGRRRLAGQLRRHVHTARRRLLCAGDGLLVPRSLSDGADRAHRGAGFLHPAATSTIQGADANGHIIFKADRTKITINDVIAAEGPREPDVDHSQKNFNTGMVIVVEHGTSCRRSLVKNVNGIRDRWIDYWSTTTGHRSTMTAQPR